MLTFTIDTTQITKWNNSKIEDVKTVVFDALHSDMDCMMSAATLIQFDSVVLGTSFTWATT